MEPAWKREPDRAHHLILGEEVGGSEYAELGVRCRESSPQLLTGEGPVQGTAVGGARQSGRRGGFPFGSEWKMASAGE